MCTVIYLQELGFLSKNRDKEQNQPEEIVSTDDLLAVRTLGADYFSLGINRFGCAFVSTAVNSPEWTLAVEEGRTEASVEMWLRDTKGRQSPSHLISRLLSSAQSKEELAQAISDANILWRGYNIVLADQNGGMVVETFGHEVAMRPLAPKDAITNHFSILPYGPRLPEDYPNSFQRLAYARQKLGTIGTLESLSAAILPDNATDQAQIWREGVFRTISSTIIDLGNMSLLYAQKPSEKYCRHGFPEKRDGHGKG